MASLLGWGVVDPFAKDLDIKKDVTRAPGDVLRSENSTSATLYSTLEDLGIDLVVTKVVMERGEYNGGRTVQVIPTSKTCATVIFCGNIKVSLPELDTAVWIRTGIGPQEE